jgi:hypothetical protein
MLDPSIQYLFHLPKWLEKGERGQQFPCNEVCVLGMELGHGERTIALLGLEVPQLKAFDGHFHLLHRANEIGSKRAKLKEI